MAGEETQLYTYRVYLKDREAPIEIEADNQNPGSGDLTFKRDGNAIARFRVEEWIAWTREDGKELRKPDLSMLTKAEVSELQRILRKIEGEE